MKSIPSALFFGALLLVLSCSSDPSGDGSGGGTTTEDSSSGDTTRRGDDTGGVDESPCTTSDDCDGDLVCDPVLTRCVSACGDDTDCAPAERCASAGGLCEARTPCSDSAACAEGEACDSCLGVCVGATGVFCVEDVNCPDFDQYCDSCSSQCLSRREPCDPCTDDAQCGEPGDRCLDFPDGERFCGKSCGAGIGCPLGFTCNADRGQCLPLSGACSEETTCGEDSECAGVQICGGQGICTDGCASDDVCPNPLVCSAGRCQDPCSEANACDTGLECVEGHCRVPGGCLTSRECPQQETYCDRVRGLCVDGCEVDGDCLTFTLMCVDGGCERRPCRGAYSCGFGQICDADSGACVESTEPHCSECNGDDAESCGAGNLCASFQDEDGNDLGAFCLLACSSDPLNECPSGYQCSEVETPDGIMNLCTRGCYDNPFE